MSVYAEISLHILHIFPKNQNTGIAIFLQEYQNKRVIDLELTTS